MSGLSKTSSIFPTHSVDSDYITNNNIFGVYKYETNRSCYESDLCVSSEWTVFLPELKKYDYSLTVTSCNAVSYFEKNMAYSSTGKSTQCARKDLSEARNWKEEFHAVKIVYTGADKTENFDNLVSWLKENEKYVMMMQELKSHVSVIGLCGKMGSGKDYIADNFIIPAVKHESHNESNVTKMSFSDQLKVACIIKGADPSKVFGEKDRKTRKFLQKEGTENGRDVHGQAIWLKYFISWAYLYYCNNNINVIIASDCRFPNEAELIKHLGGVLVKIESKERTDMRRSKENITHTHSSESHIDDIECDFAINNDSNVSIDNEYILNIVKSVL